MLMLLLLFWTCQVRASSRKQEGTRKQGCTVPGFLPSSSSRYCRRHDLAELRHPSPTAHHPPPTTPYHGSLMITSSSSIVSVAPSTVVRRECAKPVRPLRRSRARFEGSAPNVCDCFEEDALRFEGSAPGSKGARESCAVVSKRAPARNCALPSNNVMGIPRWPRAASGPRWTGLVTTG
jgi:hypothetical protein